MVKRKPEACLFCGCAPCECEPKKATPKKRIKPPVVTAELTVDAQARFKSTEKIERDLPFMNALRSIRGIVSDRDKRWIDSKVDPPLPQELDKRVSEWRAKHGNAPKG